MTLLVQGPAAARAAAGLPGAAFSIGMPDARQARTHLALLHGRNPGSLLELRSKTPTGMRQAWQPDVDLAAKMALDAARVTDVYVGVVPRARRAGGKDALVDTSYVAWVECDTPASVARAMDMTPAPQLIVRSSEGKAHCYWPLKNGCPTSELARANRRLAAYLGGDMNATDAARILRVAGTRNHKYDPVERVFIAQFNPAMNVMTSALVGHLPDPVKAKPIPVVRPLRASKDHGPDLDKERILQVQSRQYIYDLTGREVMHDMVCCPFHKGGAESTPSLHVGGPEATLWHCFGCAEGGDVFTFAARLWGLDDTNDFPELKARLAKELR